MTGSETQHKAAGETHSLLLKSKSSDFSVLKLNLNQVSFSATFVFPHTTAQGPTRPCDDPLLC